MRKRAEELATEYANSVMLSVNHKGDVRDAFWDGYERAAKDMKDKLERLKQLADDMYSAAQYLTTDASGLRKAMEVYHRFIITKYYE